MPAETQLLDVGWSGLALAAGLVLAAAGIARWQELGLEGRYLLGGLRAFVQLSLVGYALVYVFHAERWWLVLLVLGVMLAAAARAASGGRGSSAERARGVRMKRLWPVNASALTIGSGFTLFYVTQVVLRVSPWYEPRYLIPLFGMIVGNAMNGAALAAERLDAEMQRERRTVEAYLALGATPARASAELVRRALTASAIPSINGLMVVGLVQLPGMMTGQILAGASPTIAVRYQVVVAFMLAFATALTSVIVVLWRRRAFFTAAQQLVDETSGAGASAPRR
ncbi:MAG TPA: iron export ABC transporter permease subunit FetB [Polyangiaceae bacterium]|nr:iron export ABC transporter permease subunit FetB [Polyangiaceae bacterium]